ncbi:MAG: UbiD family decarboxylase [Deltaproteobacteria bacterium]|nr:UbiD family decarboxylase [Deltaproteobacteria bacterium]
MPNNEITDLRSFITRLEEEGELARIKVEVNWDLELGAIARKAYGPPVLPALLFENIKDYDTSVFTGGVATFRRIAIALGLSPESDENHIVNEYLKRIEHPIKPVIIKDGPCKENKLFGADVDMLRFPVPRWAEKDGGRYIGTWHQVITRDPETGWTNVGTYRMMVHEANICGIMISPSQHIGMIHKKYERLKKVMPIAVSIGFDPVAMFVSGAPFPAYVNEWDIAGGLRGRPIEMVKCETIDLEVPAYSEIVLEGEVSMEDLREEGPFGEHTGYYGGGVRKLPTVKIKCITCRNTPILRGSAVGVPVTEQTRLSGFVWTTTALSMYKNAGFPGVTAINCPAGGDPEYSAIIAINKSYPSQALDAGRLFLSSKVGNQMKHIIVVDDDINVYDLEQVLWAFNMRVQAGRDIYITSNESGSRLDPSVPHEQIGLTDKMIVDATWNTTYKFPPRPEWGGKVFPPVVATGPEMLEYINKRWHEYGI